MTSGPKIQFCSAHDGAKIAYSISGEGPPLVRAAHYLSHLEFDFESPVWSHWIRELSRYNSYIRYDERGCGLSDQDPPEFSFDAWVTDLETVVDTLGVDKFNLLGVSQGGAVAITYAVQHPERVSRLILYGAYARGWGKRTGTKAAPQAIQTREAMHRLIDLGWGQDNPAFRQMFTSLFVPDGGAEQQRWFNELQRVSCSPHNALRFDEVFSIIDVLHLLPKVSVPTLILHARHDGVVPLEEGRLLASQIPGARFVSFDGRNHILLETEPGWQTFLREIRQFIGTPWNEMVQGKSLSSDPIVSASAQIATQVASMTELDLSRFVVVGAYARYDERARNLLKDFRLKIKNGLSAPSPSNENYLIWGPPGSGKTYLVQQIAASIEGTEYREINLAESNEESFRASLGRSKREGQRSICLIDEVDAKPNESWPYEVMLKQLEPQTRLEGHICFVLAGSSGQSLSGMVQKISSRPKGEDLLSRIPPDNHVSVPALGFGDRIVVAITQLLGAASEEGHAVKEIEKLAIYYMAMSPKLDSARRLRDFARACVRRMPPDEDRLRFDHLFNSGDPENKAFWLETQRLQQILSDSFVALRLQAGQLSGRLAHQAERGLARPGTLPTLEKNKVAILPLKSISPDPADEYFADGMTEELISAVSKIGDLRTISRSSAMRFKATDKSVSVIAAELHVGSIVEGSVRKVGNMVRINVQLVDVGKDEHLWSQSYDRQLEDVFAIQSDIASKVAEALQIHVLAQERERIEKKATGNMESYTLYLKGLHHRGERTEEGYKKAIQYFEEALKKDPKFALAHAGLAECYELMGGEGYLPPRESFPMAEEFAKRALALDDSLAEAHATLGAVLQTYYYNQSGAEEEFRRALDLNPNYGSVCNSYGSYLACMGRMDEAVAEIGRAQELNPLALEVNNCAAVIFNCTNEFEKSVEACERMLRIDENFLPAYQDLAEAYIEKNRFDDAVGVLQKALVISKGGAPVKARLGFAYARAGRIEEARKTLRDLEEESKTKYVTPIAFAIVNCGLGDKGESIRWLEKACDERAGGVISVKVRPMWATLRSEPAFTRLLNRMGLSK